MDDGPLEATVERSPAGALVRMRGRIDREADATMSAAYREAAELAAPAIELDFTSVGYINSTGIALIVRFLAEARRERRTVLARGLSAHYREIFRITRLSDYVTLEEDDAVTPGVTAVATRGG